MTQEAWNHFVAVVRDEMLVSLEAIAQTGRRLLDKIESSKSAVPEQMREDLSAIERSSSDLYSFAQT
ncbi:MAG TPA: hypothetical protein VLA12_12205, partial [Planctomycetaceae bacterium]|nr:hypothetical protein [Planctomycetaceae bacterium]